MRGLYSRRIDCAKTAYLYSQIKASLPLCWEVTPDGEEGAHEAGAPRREASTDSSGAWTFSERDAQASGVRGLARLQANLGIRTRQERAAARGSTELRARRGHLHGHTR